MYVTGARWKERLIVVSAVLILVLAFQHVLAEETDPTTSVGVEAETPASETEDRDALQLVRDDMEDWKRTHPMALRIARC